MYAAEVVFYEDTVGKTLKEYLFVPAESFLEATEKISLIYGKDSLESIKLEWIETRDCIVFAEEDKELFERVLKKSF